MKVLVSAYACEANIGSEPGNGWGWADSLARRGMEIHVLTVPDNQRKIEPFIQDGVMPGVRFHYVDFPLRQIKGDGLRYASWQWAALQKARDLHQVEHFDIAHHVTYGSFHVPTQLWRLGIPVVFGPVGGGQVAPHEMLTYFGKDRKKEELRSLMTRLIRFSPWHRHWLGQMAAVLVSNRETLELAQALGRHDAQLMFDAVLPADFAAMEPRTFVDGPEPLHLLWVGRMLSRKAVPLALDIFAKVTIPATLTLAGEGIDPPTLRQMIADRGLSERVIWPGKSVLWEEMRATYLGHDALLFTSLRESGGVQLLEAMGTGLPIITLDHHGPSVLVPDGAGFKIRVESPQQVIYDAAIAIDRFGSMGAVEKTTMSRVAWSFAQGITYQAKAAQAETLYRRLVP